MLIAGVVAAIAFVAVIDIVSLICIAKCLAELIRVWRSYGSNPVSKADPVVASTVLGAAAIMYGVIATVTTEAAMLVKTQGHESIRMASAMGYCSWAVAGFLVLTLWIQRYANNKLRSCR